MRVKRAVRKPKAVKRPGRGSAVRSPKRRTSVNDELRQARAEATEARAEQVATAEILKIIARSPADVQPVFQALVESALCLCDAAIGGSFLFDGERVRIAALAGFTPEGEAAYRSTFPLVPTRDNITARAIVDRKRVHVPDIEATDAFPVSTRLHESLDFRAVLAVPMLRGQQCVGVITVARRAAGAFSERQAALLETFADQAVIAIENARLFNETKEALERQTATAEILNVIAGSPANVQPVFDAIVRSALWLIGGNTCSVTRLVEDHLHLAAFTSTDPSTDEEYKALFPQPIGKRAEVVEAIRTGSPQVVADVPAGLREFADPVTRKVLQARQVGSLLLAPLVREGVVTGMIHVARAETGSFSATQIALLEAFASQAVIAIENARLFNETKEALERQTATAEILNVIAASPVNVQPVFDAIVQSAARLFNRKAALRLVEADGLRRRAWSYTMGDEFHGAEVLPVDQGSLVGRAVLECKALQFADSRGPDAPPYSRTHADQLSYRSIATAPLVRDGAAIGVITVSSPDPGVLSDRQLDLLKTFADQAVIAIENVRLFNELQSRTEALTKSVGQLQALGEVSQALSSTLDLDEVLRTIVSRAVQLTGFERGAIYEYDDAQQIFFLRGGVNVREEIIELNRNEPIQMGDGFIGRAASTRAPVQVPDLEKVPWNMRARDVLLQIGARALLAVPLVREGHVLGALAVTRSTPGQFAPEVIALLETFATQSAIAIQNARLFREIEDKGRQLEEASQHKSQFLASMSHELRTPLNAILGFNEMMLDGLCGEVPEGFTDPLNEVQASGKHLLRLINNVLDLAKIEAGRMELALADYSVEDAIGSVHSTLKPLAAQKGIDFRTQVPTDLPLAYGDGGRITQCLMNLAGNSLKFTKEGKVEISVAQRDGLLCYSVADTGIGIPADKVGSLFTEFKQTDATIASEYGGTGLGLSITKKFIEMHGGRIWVESEPGKGSTFLFEVPLRAEP